MFGAKIAKAQPKVGEAAVSRSVIQRSAFSGFQPGQTTDEQGQLLQRAIQNRAPHVTADAFVPSAFSGDFCKITPCQRPQSSQQDSFSLRGAGPRLLQPKLAIGPVDDPLEREADAVADKVMRMPDPVFSVSAAREHVSRKCASCEQEDEKHKKLQAKPMGTTTLADEAPDIVHEVVRSPGRPMDVATRAFFEPRFCHDFSNVRIHDGAAAMSAARSVKAHAFTVGSDVVFAAGRYAPSNAEGQRLLAHELTHVLQQSGSHPLTSASAPPLPTSDGGPAPLEKTMTSRASVKVQRDGESETERVRKLNEEYESALANLQWTRVAELLNAFNLDDIKARRAKLKKWQIASIYQGAIDNPAVGSGSAVADATRAAWLDMNYENEIKKSAWKEAVQFLNGFNREDILARIQWRSIEDLRSLRNGAIENPVVGEKSQLVQLLDTTIATKTQPPPTQSPTSTAPIQDSGGTPDSGAGEPADAGAGVSTPAVAPELSEDDARNCSELYEQKLCFYDRSGLGGDRSGVLEADEAARYNRECREESGYPGDVTLSSAEIAELRHPRCARGTAAERRKRARDLRIADALARSAKYGNLGEEIVNILRDPVFQLTVTVGIAAYLALWFIPEPLISKVSAILTTIALISIGGFSATTIYQLAQAWLTLEDEAGDATSSDEIERAAEHFGKRITAEEAQVLVFLASLILGRALPGPKGRVPPPSESMTEAQSTWNSAPSRGNVVIKGPWGQGRASGSAGGSSYIQGSNALKIESYTAPAPEISTLPDTAPLPANDNAIPLPANDNAVAGVAAPKGVKPVIPVLPRARAKPGEAGKLDPKKFYPLYWSPLLPVVTSRVFVRTPGRERDTRKAAQASMQQQWREFRDPDFRARWVHVHHVIPLFLGGPDDLVGNGIAWPARVHLKGHRDLRLQPQMQTPPNGLPPLSGDLYDHPSGTLYVLAGYKGGPAAPPSISPAYNEPGDPGDADYEGA